MSELRIKNIISDINNLYYKNNNCILNKNQIKNIINQLNNIKVIPNKNELNYNTLVYNLESNLKVNTTIINNAKQKITNNRKDEMENAYNETREFMLNLLKQSDNPVYLRDNIEDPKDQETKLAVDKISDKLNNIFLRPTYINNYFICDSFYSNWTISDIKNIFSFQLSSNNLSSNNETISLKYPISSSIQFNLLDFNIPPYFIKSISGEWNGYTLQFSPSSRRIKITVSEIIEVYNSAPSEKYTIIADCVYDNQTYDGTNYPYISRITPINDGNIIYRFIMQDLTKINISLNDFSNDMYFPKPTMTGILFTAGNPSIFTIDNNTNPYGSMLVDNQVVYISNFNTDQPSADQNLIKQINSNIGYKITNISGNIYQFSIPIDTTGLVGVSNQTYTITVANRKILFPFIISQLRPDIVF